jgi:hypothetical protein
MGAAGTGSNQQWHWEEGNKYAIECMKALLLLNGGAPIALLTFLGGASRIKLNAAGVDAINWSLYAFAIGLLSSIVLVVMAYLTQLFYGKEGFTRRSQIIHQSTYIPLIVAFIAFCAGMYFAKNAVIEALRDHDIPQTVSPFAKVQSISAVYFPQFNKLVGELNVYSSQYVSWIYTAAEKKNSKDAGAMQGFNEAYTPYMKKREALLDALKKFASEHFQ